MATDPKPAKAAKPTPHRFRLDDNLMWVLVILIAIAGIVLSDIYGIRDVDKVAKACLFGPKEMRPDGVVVCLEKPAALP